MVDGRALRAALRLVRQDDGDELGSTPLRPLELVSTARHLARGHCARNGPAGACLAAALSKGRVATTSRRR